MYSIQGGAYMALDRTGSPNPTGPDDGEQLPPLSERPRYGDEGYREPAGFGEQATTLMPALPTAAEEAATSRSNRRLGWILAGAVVVAGVLLFAVLGVGSTPSPPLVQPPASDLDSAAALPSALPPTSSVTPSTQVPSPPPSTSPTTLPPLTRHVTPPKPIRTTPKKVVPRTTVSRTTASRSTTPETSSSTSGSAFSDEEPTTGSGSNSTRGIDGTTDNTAPNESGFSDTGPNGNGFSDTGPNDTGTNQTAPNDNGSDGTAPNDF
jgi:hypothetical protein